MKKLWTYLKPYRWQAIIAPLFKLLEAIFDLLVPLVIRQLIDVGIPRADKPYILGMCGILVVFALVGLTCALVAQYFAARTATGFSAKLRMDLFSHIQKLSYAETDRIGSPTLITRMTADVNQLQSGVNLTLRLLLRSPIIVLGAMLMAFTVDLSGGLVFAIVIPLLSAVVFTIMLRTVPIYKKAQANLDSVTKITRENLTGVRVLRAFGKERAETERFSEANEKHNRIQNFVGRITALMNPITMLIVNGGVILLLLLGGDRVNTGRMSQGDVVALTNYMAQILVELVKFATTLITVNKALASAHRVSEVLELPAGMPTRPLPTEEILEDGNAIRFENATLTYPGAAEESLTDINLEIPYGTTVGIIGSTGAGKSSLIHLIPRFYDVSTGRVLVDGQDVRTYDPRLLREKVAIVPQKAELFRGTVRSNLLWGNESATEDELWEALAAAQAKDFVAAKPEGLDAPVAQSGRNLSGGQRQRLTIARALVRKAPILILDDSSSALDYATDAALRASLKALPYRPTVLIISQRTSSIRHADCIAVMEDGELVGVGTHDELLSSCEVYREIHESQFRKGGVTA